MLNMLKKMLKTKEERKTTLNELAQKTESIEELRSVNAEITSLNEEITQLRSAIEEAEKQADQQQEDEPEFRSEKGVNQVPQGAFDPMGAYRKQAPESRGTEDPYNTMEYRQAFMEFVQTGKVLPELRLDTFTDTSDISAVIPTTILNEVIKKVTSHGQVFSRVRKLSIKGGVQVPILSLKPVATWIGEATPSSRQKIQANSSVSFSYHGLECKIATSLLADTVSLPIFEETLTDLIVEAMVIALDAAIISGDGDGKALGITKDPRVPATQIVELNSADFLEWTQWKKKVFAKMPLGYKAKAAFYMASGTFEGYIDGMVDSTGQPIGRVNYGIADGPQERFGGKEVVLVEDDIIAPYDDAQEGDVVAIYADLSNYAFNSNMILTMFRYLDHDTNQYVNKAILIADGKLLDPNGVVIVKKGGAAV